MKKSDLVKLVILLLAALTLSGCLLVPIDDGYSRGGYYRGHGGGGYYDRHDGPRRR